MHIVKIRPDQVLPQGEWDEVVVLVDPALHLSTSTWPSTRYALPVYTPEPEFNKLRVLVKRLIREGATKFECSDLATLRLLKSLGVTDITADWTLYAFNSYALKALSDLGVKRFVASPENNEENLQYLRESGYDIEFLAQQSTPLFISVTEPEPQTDLAVFKRGHVWVTTKRAPRTWPGGTRIDLSWDPPTE